MTCTYRFAGRTVKVESVYDAVHGMCSAYAVPKEKADMEITICREDIDRERDASAAAGQQDDLFSDDYIETLAVYRKIAERMPFAETVLMHGSCVAVDGFGYMFIAASGTGKSTHARLWRQMLGERAVMVNDDKPLIRMSGAAPEAFGTPWDGKHRLSSNISVPLKAICILERSETNYMEPLRREEAYPMLLQQTYRPSDVAAMTRTLGIIDRISASVSLWRLRCNMDPEAARISYGAMSAE
ncbi:MAG: hypothetical protein K6F67_04965 [Oscillospiraceae bacterium]|nr:hypothetical protein [Oscillospiraceae bacterium]